MVVPDPELLLIIVIVLSSSSPWILNDLGGKPWFSISHVNKAKRVLELLLGIGSGHRRWKHQGKQPHRRRNGFSYTIRTSMDVAASTRGRHLPST